MLLLAFLIVVILMAVAARASRKRWQLVLAAPLGLLALGIAIYPFAPDLARGKLEVTVLDVGQGDAILTAFPGGTTMLVDAGGVPGMPGVQHVGGARASLDIGAEVVSPYLWHRGLKRLDVVAVTHAHQDHLGGVHAVLENFRVRELWGGREVSRPAYRAVLEAAQARGVRVVHHIRGEQFSWDGASGRVLWPDSSAETDSAKNNDSLVLRLEHGRVALLLPGDIEAPVERTLTARGDTLAAEVLKVAHHGSKTSTSAEWLVRVGARLAVISASGNNPFGQPHAFLLERVCSAGVRVHQLHPGGAASGPSGRPNPRIPYVF